MTVPSQRKAVKKMKRMVFLAAAMLFLAGCGAEDTASPALTVQQSTDETTKITQEAEEAVKETEAKLKIEVNGYTLIAELADNPSAREFADLIREETMTLKLKEYGSFDKVGALPEEIKIDYIQGYYFSRPLPENEFLELLQKEKA